MHLFHKWSKWEQCVYTFERGFVWSPEKTWTTTEIRQRRHCLVCGKIQEEKIS